jgi:hypothetical protein
MFFSIILLLVIFTVLKLVSLYQMINDDKLVAQFNTKKYILFLLPLFVSIGLLTILEYLKSRYNYQYNMSLVSFAIIVISNLTQY